jgi:hypothetical protein
MFNFLKKGKYVILRDGFLVVTPILKNAQEASDWLQESALEEDGGKYKIVLAATLIADWGLENL